ncbi:uncharacterized protein NECHADRAFT_77025 [Fusarium vanettenii 77-13-4]|uniref:Protein kinase domain-containing protein n=1 Tax=Fusarium vanettenii (strain ATCC MYA-4622 / CBS 123669 / FGSC 9596 / NRRL 45880 / 77-13-4) TaxID=660122 RepID=C7ZCE5_FUSV7|nr:uncharacterized protein NECHADRAFT_77025 [Fusarium vanettenii 77-13-4]EEU38356.1 predicted protein [Fusarium vanettenii 77-13-4]
MNSQIRAADPQLEPQHLSIHHAKESCFRRIDDCLAQQNPEFVAKAQTVEQMLQLWAKHSGVDARKGMSLDDRLKDHLDLKATLIGLLELIEQKMGQALSSPDEHGDAETAPAFVSRDNDDIDPEEFLIKQKWRSYKGNAWETVGGSIDMLIELTAMIRKSTVRNASLPSHFHRPDDYFAEYSKLLARNWFKDARRSFTDQLGDSVFVRRNHMLYKMKHEEKISYSGADLTPVPSEPTPAPLLTTETRRGMEPLKETTLRIGSPHPAARIFANPTPSSTNLSQFDRNKFKQRNRKIGALSGITEGSVSVEETSFSYMYPEPPALGEKERYGVCPYCSVLLSASKLTKGAWRQHLHEDIQPYVCISEKCRHPAQFFSNSTQWLQHMDKFHGRDWPQRVHMATWFCDKEHDRLEFKSECELQKHLNRDHTSLSDAHVNALVRRNWGVGCREPHVCPLCESTPSNIVPLMNNKDKALLLCRHIGDHLKAIALFSLPSLSTDPANDEQKSSSGAQLPSNEDSGGDSARKNQAVAQLVEDLEGSLTFDDDPSRLVDAVASEATINERHISDVPSDLDAALEWKFASSEQEPPELDPVLEILRRMREEEKLATNSTEQLGRASLYKQIRTKLVKSVFDEAEVYFLPNGSLDSLITKESVVRELLSSKAQHKAEVESLAEFILISAKKLFGIVILLTDPTLYQLIRKRMEVFRNKGMTDSNLPLQGSWWVENFSTGAIGDTKIEDVSDRSIFGYDELWPISTVEYFCIIQHRFLAPVFSSTGLSYDFEPDTILPFTERDTDLSQPAWNIRYRIHEKHINQETIDTRRPYYVDVKKAYDASGMESSWDDDVETLSHINSLNHEHLVRFLAAFRRGRQDGYFMFEWASGGNLRNLWLTFHRPKLTSGLVKSAFRQMAGLASAINRVHSDPKLPCLPHSDLKPEHIYVFSNHNGNELGTLKIGAGELWSEIESERGHFAYETKWGWSYEAPELNNSGLYFKEPQPRASDIWSMGCIMLEFLIWLIYGMDGLHRFSGVKQSAFVFSARDFYQETQESQDGTRVVTVDPIVLKWMDHMAADPACEVETTALGNLLELIRTRLLVVKPPPDHRLAKVFARPHSSVASQSHQTWERCTSSELEERMREISDKNETERYWLAAQPKSPPEIKRG